MPRLPRFTSRLLTQQNACGRKLVREACREPKEQLDRGAGYPPYKKVAYRGQMPAVQNEQHAN